MKPTRHLPALPAGWKKFQVTMVALGVVISTGGCRRAETAKAPETPTNALAVVGGGIITIESFQHELARRIRAMPPGGDATAEKQAVLNEMIRFEVLYQNALAAHTDQDPQVLADMKRMIVARFQERQWARTNPPTATSAEIEAFYQKSPHRFGTPARVRAALIEFPVARTATTEKRKEVAARAEKALAEAKASPSPDHTFGLIAQKCSEHQPSRYRGGDIGWLNVGATNSDWPPAVLEAIFKLSQPGETSPVIETAAGFYLVRLVEQQPARMRPLNEVRDGVAYLLVRQRDQQRQDEWHATLKQGLNIQINQALLDSVVMPREETKPPAMPGESASFSAASPERFGLSNQVTSGITPP